VVPVHPSGKGSKQSKTLKSEEDGVLESGLLGVCNRGEKLEFRKSFKFGGQHSDEILITLVGVRFGEKVKVNFGEGCTRSTHR
jgi:hypothetical protein